MRPNQIHFQTNKLFKNADFNIIYKLMCCYQQHPKEYVGSYDMMPPRLGLAGG